jgi:hypothetical protein
MSWLTKLFQNIDGFFESPAAKQAEVTIQNLIPFAAPIVAQIAALTPNRTVQQIELAYAHYAVPFAANLATASPTAALQQLAAAVLAKNHAPGAAVSLVNTAVELALQSVKVRTPPPAAV